MLLGNYSVLNRAPMRYLAGGTATPEVGSRANWQQNGNGKNRQYVAQTTAANKQFSLPYGSYPPYATLMPQKAGDMAARRSADFAITPAATGVLGMPGVGSASWSITTNAPDGQLITSGSGSTSFAITANGTALATLSGDGSASFAITTNTPLLGALAWLQATGAFSVGASLTSYAVGNMAGTTEVTTVLTTDAIAQAVWAAIAAANNDAGTMGAKLNSAASGGVDYNTLADAVRNNLQAELLRIVELAQLHGLVVGTDLVVTPTNRTAGSVAQTIATTGNTTTVTRSP